MVGDGGGRWGRAVNTAFAPPDPVAADGPPDVLIISTYTAEDPDNGSGKAIVARTRVAPDGMIETLVADRCADHCALLELHRAMVEQALAARRGR